MAQRRPSTVTRFSMANRTPCGEESEIAIGDLAADQQPSCPDTGECRVEIIGIEVGQFEIDPIMQSRVLGPIACRQALPDIVRQGFGDVLAVPATASGLSHERKR